MKALAVAFAAFTGFPAGPTRLDSLLPVTPPVGWTDRLWAEPTTADDEPLDPAALEDFLVDADDLPPHVMLEGCALALSGGLTPETWSRELWLGLPFPRIVESGHTERDGRWIDYDNIPRRPDRPEAYTAYRYPVAAAPVVSGYDLDKPDDEQRRGSMNAIGHGGVDLVAEMDAPITMIRLEHQKGDAEVLYVGPFFGETVITRHVLREGGGDHDYVLIFGHLDHAADGLRRGRRLPDGAAVGYVGNSDSPSLVHLHLEARRVRDGVDAWKLAPDTLRLPESTVVSDPRNVLPLASPAPRRARCAPRLVAHPRRYWLGDAMSLALPPVDPSELLGQ
jgi:hypothetical protein